MLLGRKLHGSYATPPALQTRQALPPLARSCLPDCHAAICCSRCNHVPVLGGRPLHLHKVMALIMRVRVRLCV